MTLEEENNTEINNEELEETVAVEDEIIEEEVETLVTEETPEVEEEISEPTDVKLYKWNDLNTPELKKIHADIHATMSNSTLFTRAEEAGEEPSDFLFNLFEDEFDGDRANFNIALNNVKKETGLTLELSQKADKDAFLDDFFGQPISTPEEGGIKYKEENGQYFMSNEEGDWNPITERTFELGKRRSIQNTETGEWNRGKDSSNDLTINESDYPQTEKGEGYSIDTYIETTAKGKNYLVTKKTTDGGSRTSKARIDNLITKTDKKEEVESPTSYTRERFATGLVSAENSGEFDYNAINSESSATGAYQFLYEREDVKAYLQKTHGITSREEFQGNKEAQEALLDYMLEDKPERYPFMAKAIQKKYKNHIPKEIGYNQLLALEHFAGHGELRELFAGVRDGKRTKEEVLDFVPKAHEASNLSIGEYLKRFNEGFNGVEDKEEIDIMGGLQIDPIISVSDQISTQIVTPGEDANQDAIADSREIYEQGNIIVNDIAPSLQATIPQGSDVTQDLDDVWNDMNLSAIEVIKSNVTGKMDDENVLEDEANILRNSLKDEADVEEWAEIAVNTQKTNFYINAATGMFNDIESTYQRDIEQKNKDNQAKKETAEAMIKSRAGNIMMPGQTTSIMAATKIESDSPIQFTAEEWLSKDKYNNIPPAMKLIMAEHIQSLYDDKKRQPEFLEKRNDMLGFWGKPSKENITEEVQKFVDESFQNGNDVATIISNVNESFPVTLSETENGELSIDYDNEELYNNIDNESHSHALKTVPGQTNIDSSAEMVLKGSWNETIPGYLQWALTGRKPFEIIGRTPTENEAFLTGLGGFILDPTMWIPGAAVGFGGTKVGTRLLTRHLAKWETQLALKYGDEAAKKTINLLSQAQASKITKPIASGATLGAWKFNHETLSQRVQKSGWGTNDIDYWDSLQEGGVDFLLGASIFGTSSKIMGKFKLMDEAMALKGASPLTRNMVKYGVAHPLDLAAQTTVFVGGGAVLHGEIPTIKEAEETAKFLLSMKFAHGVQNGMFTYVKTGSFKKGEAPAARFSEIERDIISTKFNVPAIKKNASTSEKVEWDNNSSEKLATDKYNLNDLINDKNVPLTLRSKVLMREFGLKLGMSGEAYEDEFTRNRNDKALITSEVKTIFDGAKGNFDVVKLNEYGDVIDAVRFKNSVDANTYAQKHKQHIADNLLKFEFDKALSLDNKVEVVDYLKNELNSSLHEITEILNNTNPNERTLNQNILVEKFKAKVYEISEVRKLEIKEEATLSLESKKEEVTEKSLEAEIIRLQKLKSEQDKVILEGRIKSNKEQKENEKQKAENEILRNFEEALKKEPGKPIYATEESLDAINKETLTDVQKEALEDVNKSIKAFKNLGLDVYLHTSNKEYSKEVGESIEGISIQGHRNTKTGEIHFNLSHIDRLTASHEIGHHFSEILKEAAPDKYKAIEGEVFKLINETPEYAEILDLINTKDKKGEDVYKSTQEKKDEAVAEFIAKLQKGDYTVQNQNKYIDKIKIKLNELMESLGLDYKFETNNEALSFLDNMTKKISKGEEISLEEFSTKKEPAAGKRLFNKPNPESKEISKEYIDVNKELIGESSEVNLNFKLDVKNSQELADAFEQMKNEPNNPEVIRAYNALATETVEQFKLVNGKGYKVEIWKGEGEPYANSAEMIKDVKENKHMYIYSTEAGFGQKGISKEQRAENPLLESTEFTDINGEPLLVNDLFRFVHDFFGHTEFGNGFGAKGEEIAWMNHSKMYSVDARKALTTETRGQNSWVNFGPQMRKEDGSMYKKGEEGYLSPKDREYAPQKIGLLPTKFTITPEAKGKGDTQLRAKNQVEHHNEEGGSTFNQSGDVVTEGFAVSRYPDRTKIVEGKKVTEQDIIDFKNDNKDILSENPNAVVGTWYNAENGKTYIDISEVRADRAEAIQLGKDNNQIAIMDLETFEEISTEGTGEAFAVTETFQDIKAARPETQMEQISLALSDNSGKLQQIIIERGGEKYRVSFETKFDGEYEQVVRTNKTERLTDKNTWVKEDSLEHEPYSTEYNRIEYASRAAEDKYNSLVESHKTSATDKKQEEINNSIPEASEGYVKPDVRNPGYSNTQFYKGKDMHTFGTIHELPNGKWEKYGKEHELSYYHGVRGHEFNLPKQAQKYGDTKVAVVKWNKGDWRTSEFDGESWSDIAESRSYKTRTEAEFNALKWYGKEVEIPSSKSQLRVDKNRDRVFTEINNIISKTKSRLTEDVNPETLLNNSLSYLKESKWYEKATDQERELAVRDVRNMLSIKEKKAPGVKKIVGSPKEKQVTISEKVALKEVLKSEVKGAKGAETYIKQINSKLVDHINNSDLKDSAIGKSLLKKVAKVTTEKEFDKVVDALEVATERQNRRDLIGNVRVLKEKVRKKLKKGEYTNQSELVEELLNTPSHKLKETDILNDLVTQLENLNRKNVALLEPKEIESLEKSISDLVKKSKKSIPSEFSLGELGNNIKSKLDSKINTEAPEGVDDIKSLRSDILRYERNLEELNIEGKLSDGEYQNHLTELNTFINKFKGKSTEFNQERFDLAKDILKELDTSKLTGDNKRIIEELKDNVVNEGTFIDDMSFADNLYVTALDLSFTPGKTGEAYIPTHVIAKLNRKAFAHKNSKNLAESISKGVEDLGISDMSQVEIENILSRQNLAFVDDAVGTGKKGIVYKTIINPIERSMSSFLTDVGNTMAEFNVALGRKVSEKTSFDTENKRRKLNTKVGMLMIQNQENLSGSERNVWGHILSTENRKKTYKNPETPKLIQEIYDALPKTLNKDGDVIVDVKKAYKGLTAREKRVFDASRKILDGLEVKQKHVNEYRGIPFNAIEGYVPLLGKSENSKADSDGYTIADIKDKPWANNMANSNVKMASDRGKARTTKNIRMYEPNIEKIITDAVQQVNRDYHLTESYGKMGETINHVKNNWSLENKDGLNVFANAIKSRMVDAAKYQFSTTPGTIAQKFMGATYAFKLARAYRIPIELATEVYRINVSAGNKYSPEAIMKSGMERLNVNRINAKNKILSFMRSDSKLEDLSSGVKYDKEYTTFDKLLQQTNSPYIHKFNRWQIEGQYDMNKIMANKGVITGMAQYALGMPDRMTIHMAWMPQFMAEFKNITGEKFSYEKYGEDASYGEKHNKAILEAASKGDRAAQMYKNTAMKSQQRTLIRTLNPLAGKNTFNYYTDANSKAAPYLTYMSTFGALESAMFGKSISDASSGINSTKTDGARAAVGIFSAGVGYGMMTAMEYHYGSYLYNQSVYGENSPEALEKAEEMAKILSPERIGLQLVANASFLAVTRYSQSARILALSAAGLLSQSTDNMELRAQLDALSSKILMGDPILDGKYGDKLSILDDLAPNINYGLGVIQDNIQNIGDFDEYYNPGTDNDEERIALWRLAQGFNDLQKLYFMTKFGTQLFGQKYMDKHIRKELEILKNRAPADYNDLR